MQKADCTFLHKKHFLTSLGRSNGPTRGTFLSQLLCKMFGNSETEFSIHTSVFICFLFVELYRFTLPVFESLQKCVGTVLWKPQTAAIRMIYQADNCRRRLATEKKSKLTIFAKCFCRNTLAYFDCRHFSNDSCKFGQQILLSTLVWH
jgi:hypothetical protein